MSEIWRPVSISEGIYADFYEVSNLGRIRSKDRISRHALGGESKRTGRVISLRMDRTGYLSASLSLDGDSRRFTVHRIVAASFLPKPPDTLREVNHKDFNKTNNTPDNLEWVDRKTNMAHAYSGGKLSSDKRLAKNNARRAKKMTPETVASLRRDGRNGMTYPQLAEKYGISVSGAAKIFREEVWK